ncbi:MAG TPA: hypothetical protein VIX41_08900 [Acidimicrobiales bacterium]
MTVYGERVYREAKQVLARTPTPCSWGCGRRATTPDHVPALAAHRHIPGSGCCVLVPACGPCNYGRGARLRNRTRVGARPGASRRW